MLYLASDEAAFVTGAELVMDGGGYGTVNREASLPLPVRQAERLSSR